MSSMFRGGGADPHKTVNLTDDAYESAAEHPPVLKASIGLAEVIFGMFANVVQVTTSGIAILSLMVGSAVSLSQTLGEVHAFTWRAVIAFTLSFAIQLFLHMNAQSMSSTWHRLRHLQHFQVKSTHALSDVLMQLDVRNLYCVSSLVGDVISDATFINLFTRSAVVIVGWMVFLTGSSTLLFYDGVTRIWGAIEDAKDYAAYHAKHQKAGA